jgi:purine-binding chemotaxis protein CheW
MEAAAQATQPGPPAKPGDDRSEKYLVFQLGVEEFGIRVLKVREIIGVQDITAVPQTPKYLKGVINLRGKIIPVLDLRLKLRLAPRVYTPRTCIIVVQVNGDSGPQLMGVVVDSVAEVVNIPSADIEETPNFGDAVPASYLLGVAKVKGKIRILLDVDLVVAEAELPGMQQCTRDANGVTTS